MPTIKLLTKKKPIRRTNKRDPEVRAVYDTRQWRSLRMEKLRDFPLCEQCDSQGVITPADEVHHVRNISSGTTARAKLKLGFDFANLMSLCRRCHILIHKEERNARRINQKG